MGAGLQDFKSLAILCKTYCTNIRSIDHFSKLCMISWARTCKTENTMSPTLFRPLIACDHTPKSTFAKYGDEFLFDTLDAADTYFHEKVPLDHSFFINNQKSSTWSEDLIGEHNICVREVALGNRSPSRNILEKYWKIWNSKNMNSIFCELKKTQKVWISFSQSCETQFLPGKSAYILESRVIFHKEIFRICRIQSSSPICKLLSESASRGDVSLKWESYNTENDIQRWRLIYQIMLKSDRDSNRNTFSKCILSTFKRHVGCPHTNLRWFLRLYLLPHIKRLDIRSCLPFGLNWP